MKFLDEIFADCADDDFQGHGLELEVYKFDYANRNWNGPYLFWSSELYETSKKWSNVKAEDFDQNRQRVIYYVTKPIVHGLFIKLYCSQSFYSRLIFENLMSKLSFGLI